MIIVNHFRKENLKMLAFVILFITFVVSFFTFALTILFKDKFKIARFFALVSSINFIVSMIICAFN